LRNGGHKVDQSKRTVVIVVIKAAAARVRHLGLVIRPAHPLEHLLELPVGNLLLDLTLLRHHQHHLLQLPSLMHSHEKRKRRKRSMS
jgi:hypothetical protein